MRDVTGRSTDWLCVGGGSDALEPASPLSLVLNFASSPRPSGLQDGRPDHFLRQHVLPREAGFHDWEPALRDVR